MKLSSRSFQWAIGGSVVVCFGLLLCGGWLFFSSYQAFSSQPDQGEAYSSTQNGSASTSSAEVKKNMIWVDVSGAVNKPGLYALPEGSRVAAAVAAATGLHRRADQAFLVEQLNLARVLQDGEKIHIPFANQTNTSSSKNPKNEVLPAVVSLNQSSVDELSDLPGIGEKWAEKIVQNRPYVSLDEFRTKTQLSTSLWQKISALVSL